jgi:sugar O-acyltransferase (sialic acid O-acetyltransferase NeuD family)
MSRWLNVISDFKKIIVWGASDQFRVNYKILIEQGYKIVALIDDTESKQSPINHIPIFKGFDGLNSFLAGNHDSLGFVIAIGNPYGHVRLNLGDKLKQCGLFPISFSDASALVCSSVKLGEGAQIMPLAIIHNDVFIGNQCIINTRSLIEHDCILDDAVEIGPGAVLCGRVHVGQGTWIGANATIKPRIVIGKNCIIGAGSVVVKDIPDNSIVVGVPAKFLKRNEMS